MTVRHCRHSERCRAIGGTSPTWASVGVNPLVFLSMLTSFRNDASVKYFATVSPTTVAITANTMKPRTHSLRQPTSCKLQFVTVQLLLRLCKFIEETETSAGIRAASA